jgi:O-antigen/teichoic acid export membrane protein
VFARLKNLFGSLAVYGFGDMATSLVSLLLLPIYTRYLSPSDYGILAMLVTIEAVAKITFRWGVDTAFMRLYYDCTDLRARQRLASTIFFFLLAINGICVVGCVLAAGWFSGIVFRSRDYGVLIALTVTNTFIAGFFFIPLHVLRIGQRATQFVGITFARSAGTLVLRLVLVIAVGMGVRGIVVADIVMTTLVALALTRWYAPLIRPVFSRPVLREVLAFGLPRIPHSLAQQVIGLSDRYFLNAYGTLRDVGIYSIGSTFGQAPKYFLAAFEYAWTPFFLGAMHEPDAKRIYSSMSTYVVGTLTLLVAGLCAISPDIVRLATAKQFHGTAAAAVIPWIALGAMFQGLYVVGSIGIVITKQTRLYPLATGCAAAVSLLVNALLVPRFGFMGAAWANTIAYGTLAAVTVSFSLRSYPIPYEWGRLLKVAVAGVTAYGLAALAVPATMSPLPGVLLRGGLATATYAVTLVLTGFFHAGEFGAFNEIRRRILQRRRGPEADRDIPPALDDLEP